MSDHSKRLLICSPSIPHESQGASVVLFFHYIEGLKKANFKILNLLILQPNNYSEQALAEYTEKIAVPGKFDILPCLADRYVITSGRSSISLTKSSVDDVLQKAKSFQPDVIFYIDLLSAWVGEHFSASKKVVWLGDLNFQTVWYHAWYTAKEKGFRFSELSKAYARSQTLGKKSKAILKAWYTAKEMSFRFSELSKAYARSQTWKEIYKAVLQEMDLVIVSSNSSRKHLRRLGIDAIYQPYPWPNRRSSDDASQVEQRKKPTFLFYGTLVALGSRSAFHFMIGKLYPRLLSLWGNNGFQILIAGSRQLTPWAEREIADKPEFKYLGFVDDLDSLMASCHAVIAPIDVPVGNRSRIVTAMAKGTLVIAHKNTSLGNPDLIDGVTCYLARNARQFVRRMQRAVECPRQVEDMISNARDCYERRFHPDIAAEMLVKEIVRISDAKACELPAETSNMKNGN